jgi:hypothetical protein
MEKRKGQTYLNPGHICLGRPSTPSLSFTDGPLILLGYDCNR